MAQRQILKGSTARLSFSIRDYDRSLKTPDALPTITGAQLGGSAIATTGWTVAQQLDTTPANITGRYYVIIPNTVTSGWSLGVTGEVQIQATVGGVVCPEEIQFVVFTNPTQIPYIDVD